MIVHKMSSDPSQRVYDIIDTPEAMPALLDALDKAENVGIDIEADSYHHFHHKICLIQLALANRCYIVDPLAGLDLTELMAVLSQKRLIFHDAGYDLRMLLADFAFQPKNEIFDTLTAARLTGLENFSLCALLESIVNVQLSKHNQRADWAKRPIDNNLLIYAAEDVRYLEKLTDYLDKKLRALNRCQWHREYCEWTIAQSQATKTPQDPEKRWRIRGTNGLKPRQLAFVRAVWTWRQDQADRADVAPFRILHNEHLLYLALWAERQHHLCPGKLPRLPRHCVGKRRQELLDALLEAQGLVPDQWPTFPPKNTHQRPAPEVVEKAEQLRIQCHHIAQSLGLTPSLIASRKSLLAAVNTRANTEDKLLRIGWMRWQARLILPALQKVLE